MKKPKHFISKGLGILLVCFSLTTHAQFSPAITPNQTIALAGGQTSVIGVANTDAFLHNLAGVEFAGIVRDGSDPSFSVVFGPTGSPLANSGTVSLAGNALGTVTDPSVIVTPYFADGLALVTYILTDANGISNTFMEAYSLTTAMGITLILPPTQLSAAGNTAICASPNMDINGLGQYVVSWVQGDLVVARAGNLVPGNLVLSTNLFDVTANTPPMTISSLAGFNSSMDVAINDVGRVNFAYSDGSLNPVVATLYFTSTTFTEIFNNPGAATGATITLPAAPAIGPFSYYAPKVYMHPGSQVAHIAAVGNDLVTTSLSNVIGWTVNTNILPVLILPAPGTIVGAIPGGGPLAPGLAINLESPAIAGTGTAGFNCISVGWSYFDFANPTPILGGAYTVVGRSYVNNLVTSLPIGITTLNLFQTGTVGSFGGQFDRALSLSGKFSGSNRTLAVWYDAINNQILYKMVACGAVSYKTAQEEVATSATVEGAANQLAVYPNPFSNQLTVEFDLAEGDQAQKIEVFNLTGQVVQQENISGAVEGNNRIQLNSDGDLAGGMYFVKVTTAQSTQTIKVQKTN